MSSSIERVAVIGAGTMGAAIAAQVANAGLPVLLLDIVPDALTPQEEAKGLGLDHPAVRNRLVRDGLERIKKLKPASFMSAGAERLITPGNLEDDLERIADADWIVEAVVERLEVKRALLERIEAVRRPGSIVTTNTSGLPIASIVDGRGDHLRRAFFGTHFFNPPRYMKLLEVIAGADTDPQQVDALASFAADRLGKGVVRCHDTPNFIANRVLGIHGTFVIDHALQNGYRIEEVDAVTGPLIGRPKTATFRLQDLVGIDVAAFVAKNLYDLIPDDPYREILRAPAASRAIGGLIERGFLGNKRGQGFYKKERGANGASVFKVVDLETFDYRPAEPVHFPALDAVGRIADPGERLRTLFGDAWRDDRGAQLAWAVTGHFLGYAAAVAQEVADDLVAIDRAVRWGFSYQDGPFELWDRLGVAETVARMKAENTAVAAWIETMLGNDCPSFYRRDDAGRATGYYDWTAGAYAPLAADPRHLRVDDLRADGKTVDGNRGASLHDLGDGVLLLEFHSKANAIDDRVVAMLERARELLDGEAWDALVIGNDGANFCVGANLGLFLEAVTRGRPEQLGAGVASLQGALQALRYAPKPVVAAVHGLALGGGCEIAVGVDRVVAAAESYLGQAEAGVGLVPAGGGMKEQVRRHLSPAMALADADPLPVAQKIFQTVALANVSTSAAEARELGFLAPQDRIVMNRDQLLFEAKQEALGMVADGYTPPIRQPLYAAGRDLYAALKLGIWSMQQAGWASEHDALVAERTAYVLTGGDLSAGQWVDEDYFLKLEREAIVALAQTEKTQARMRHTLATGKPLRN